MLAPGVGRDVSLGASIAVDGVCLTVTVDQPAPSGRCLCFDVMAETLRAQHARPAAVRATRSTWNARCAPTGGSAATSSRVTSTASAVVAARQPGDGWETVRFDLPEDLARYVAEKGSVAVDGVSLTVDRGGPDLVRGRADPRDAAPHHAWAGDRSGSPVNLEVDVLAKYTERLLDFAAVPAGMPLTREAAR